MSQLKWFAEIGRIVPLSEILDNPDSDELRFAITFDDGWVDNYEYALPVLKELRLPATIFLVTSAIDSGRLFWVEEFIEKISIAKRDTPKTDFDEALATLIASLDSTSGTAAQLDIDSVVERLKRIPRAGRLRQIADLYAALGISEDPITGRFLSWQQVKDMRADDITYGSHTVSHEILPYLQPHEIDDELGKSKKRLESELDQEIDTFCYPNARLNEQVAERVAAAGYRFGIKIDNEPVPPMPDTMRIPRFSMSSVNTSSLSFLAMRLLGLPGY